ncbi:MAG: dCTP deaminase, partial [Halobacteriaceae archaeon]
TPMIEPVATTRRNADDTYEWWYLDHGQYIVEYNESLSEDTKVIIQPHPNLLQVGGVHPTYITDTLQNVPLVAPTGGLRIKENARISTLYEYPNG